MSDSHRTVAHDVAFAVPFVQRLRFTTDLFGRDQQTLADVLEPSGQQPARIQFWVDEHLGKSHPELKARLQAFVRAHAGRVMMPGNVQMVPGGEAVKNDIEILQRMLKCIHAADLDRRSYIVVIGGGAVLDAVGLAAAVSHRGIRLIRIPTTTLAQADSGVGVKNSVNLFDKKNWVGTFAVPWAVINDARLLETLPARDFLCGFSEAVKVTLLKDAAAFRALCGQARAIRRRDMRAAGPVIRASARLHLDHITQNGDPFEMLEARPLDFGHWSAHKLEVMSGFSVRHGEAVAIGVALDSLYSTRVHGLHHDDALRIVRCLGELGLPLTHPLLQQTETLFEGLEEFRQHLGGRLTLTMLAAPGQPLNVHDVDEPAMIDSMQELAELAADYPRAASDVKSRPKR
jgi:3-dehydroquinate synthase